MLSTSTTTPPVRTFAQIVTNPEATVAELIRSFNLLYGNNPAATTEDIKQAFSHTITHNRIDLARWLLSVCDAATRAELVFHNLDNAIRTDARLRITDVSRYILEEQTKTGLDYEYREFQHSACVIAAEYGRQDIVSRLNNRYSIWIWSNGHALQALEKAVKNNHINVVQFLIRNSRNNDKATILYRVNEWARNSNQKMKDFVDQLINEHNHSVSLANFEEAETAYLAQNRYYYGYNPEPKLRNYVAAAMKLMPWPDSSKKAFQGVSRAYIDKYYESFTKSSDNENERKHLSFAQVTELAKGIDPYAHMLLGFHYSQYEKTRNLSKALHHFEQACPIFEGYIKKDMEEIRAKLAVSEKNVKKEDVAPVNAAVTLPLPSAPPPDPVVNQNKNESESKKEIKSEAIPVPSAPPVPAEKKVETVTIAPTRVLENSPPPIPTPAPPPASVSAPVSALAPPAANTTLHVNQKLMSKDVQVEGEGEPALTSTLDQPDLLEAKEGLQYLNFARMAMEKRNYQRARTYYQTLLARTSDSLDALDKLEKTVPGEKQETKRSSEGRNAFFGIERPSLPMNGESSQQEDVEGAEPGEVRARKIVLL